jgi:molybdopterin biosynthesis enzyme MoaB
VNNTSAAGVLVTGGSGVTAGDIVDIKNAIFNEIMEGAESFAEQIRLIRAEAAGTITRSGTTHQIKSADGVTDRITATADETGRTVTAVNGN